MPTRILLLAAAAATAALAAPPAPVAEPKAIPPRGYVCHRAAGPVTIDGKLDDKAWAAAAWSDPFADIEGDAKPKPRHRTRVKMVWDDEALYVATELDEPHVWGTIKTHDEVIFRDNDFEVFLDPDGDSHLYAELELNALNTTWDLLLTKPYKDGGHAVNAWEITGLKTAVKVNGTINDPTDTDTGWTLEIKWPWAGLAELSTRPVPPKDGEQWRINFSRVEWDVVVKDGMYEKVKGRPEYNWVWSPQGVIDMHRPERWGYLQFSTAAAGTVPLRPDPSADARELLHTVYYAQRLYKKDHGKYAPDAATLKVAAPGVKIETTTGGFEASVYFGNRRRATITHDGRVTVD